MTNYNKRLDKIFPDESKDTELQHHLRNVWHDNFSEQEFIDEMEAYITSLIKELVAEARIDELEKFVNTTNRSLSVKKLRDRLSALKSQQEEV